ncbi:MAG: methyltransferase, partial [Corynebacterium glyciniphilum]|nr:methyltransferase [Corynebacterium glyciniphilum]
MKYTHGHGPAVLANHVTRTAQDSMAFVLPYLHRDSRVLDVGCGPGSITLDLAAAIAGEGGAASQV